MNPLKMRMMAALTIFTISAFAQNNTTKAPKEQSEKVKYSFPMPPEVMMDQSGKYPGRGIDLTKSPKEQMKMDVMKIYTCPKDYDVTSDMPGKYSMGGFALNLSPKEQMKMDVMKFYTGSKYPDVNIDKSGKCLKCLTLIKPSPKEKMKMKVMRM